jgi:hypothetical protein
MAAVILKQVKFSGENRFAATVYLKDLYRVKVRQLLSTLLLVPLLIAHSPVVAREATISRQVDYLYECKDQVCETRSDFASGKANKLIRQITQGTTRKFEIFERRNGQMLLVDKGSEQVKKTELFEGIADHTEGFALCDNCDETITEFVQMVDDMKDIQEHVSSNISDLKRKGDFYVSRIGILIHENCFEPGRWQFNIEEAIVDSMVQGMACLAEGHQIVEEDGGIEKASTKYSLFPQFVNHMKQGQMIFCETDDIEKAAIASTQDKESRLIREKALDYASVGHNGYIKYGEKTYKGGFVVLKIDQNANRSKEEVMATIFHGTTHNLGYIHEDHDELLVAAQTAQANLGSTSTAGKVYHNDYAYLCEVGCFPEVYTKLLGQSKVEAAYRHCLDYNISRHASDTTYDIRELMRGKYNN